MATYTTTQRPSLEFPESHHKEITLVLNKTEAIVIYRTLIANDPEGPVQEYLGETLREALLR